MSPLVITPVSTLSVTVVVNTIAHFIGAWKHRGIIVIAVNRRRIAVAVGVDIGLVVNGFAAADNE